MKKELIFIGDNIRFLRRQSGLTLAELARKAGMSQGPLGRIERGINAPSASVIYSLSKALGVSVNAFFIDNARDLGPVRFKERHDPFIVTIADEETVLPNKTQAMAREIIGLFQALEDICHAQKRANIPLSVPFESTRQGMEALSERIRHIMGIHHGVVFDYFELFENQGFRVIVLPLPGGIDGFSFYDPPWQNAFFFLNARKNPERQLFGLACELGRVLILTQTIHQGRESFMNGFEKDSQDEEPFTAKNGAKRFAATFLMPGKAVCDTVKQLGIQKKQWSYELLLRIKHRFGVSAETFLYRLNELGLIDPALIEPLKKKIYDYYEKTDFKEPDSSRRLLTANGRLWDLVLTGREVEDGCNEVLKIERMLKKWKVVKC